MHFSTLALLSSAAAVMAAPTEPIVATKRWIPSPADGDVIPFHIKDQGDGFYLATFNETGLAHVDFTPTIREVGDSDDAAVNATVSESPASVLSKRAGTTCNGYFTSDLPALTRANRQLARNADRKWYESHAWGWVHDTRETSFFCNYQANWLTYDLIIDMHTVVSKKCKEPGYGYDRRTNSPQGPRDLSVGRTNRGDHFCTKSFHG